MHSHFIPSFLPSNLLCSPNAPLPAEYTSGMTSEPYNYYDPSSYWSSYSAWQQGYYESEPTSDGYNSYVSDRKPEEDELELIGMQQKFLNKLFSRFCTTILQVSWNFLFFQNIQYHLTLKSQIEKLLSKITTCGMLWKVQSGFRVIL